MNTTTTTMDLSGTWQVHLSDNAQPATHPDPPQSYPSVVRLPGALGLQGFGRPPSVETPWTGSVFDRAWYDDERFAEDRKEGSVRIPFWLQPQRVFVGDAWFRRVVSIPAGVQGKRAFLCLERPHWKTRVWIDGRYVGSCDSLSTPHRYDLGVVEAGERLLVIHVDNRMIVPVGPNSHSVSDHTQGNWNGIVGDLSLSFENVVCIDNVQSFASVKRRSTLLQVSLSNASGRAVQAQLKVSVQGQPGWPRATSAVLELPPGVSSESLEFRFPDDVPLWDEFTPVVHQLVTELFIVGELKPCDTQATGVGLRELAIRGTQITLNGRPLFLRGTLECCVFPLTGYPPTDTTSWRAVLRRVKDHGLNHVRFHSWCPPEAAFAVADELGLFLQVECSTWANQGAGVGVDPGFDAWLHRETERIVDCFGNHPSFVLMASGNEPDGRMEDFLGLWVSSWRQRDARRLYTSGAGWPALDESDYHNLWQPRIQAWGAGLNSRINGRAPETETDYRGLIQSYGKPCVSHEIGQWCAFPNFEEIAKYTGLMQAKNFEIFRDLLVKNGMGEQAHDFLLASGRLQVACYKEEIESSLRTPGFAGFQLLGLSDFPGQGTALVGVVDAFWDSKGYVEPEEFREFCAPTVPLARLSKRYWKTTDTFVAGIEVAHFGSAPLYGTTLVWELQDKHAVKVAGGTNPVAALPTGQLSPVFSIYQKLDALPGGHRYQLVVTLVGPSDRTVLAVNRWDIWVFDAVPATPLPAQVHLSGDLDAAALVVLERGGDVLLSLAADKIRSDVELGFSSVFWNTLWTNGQAPHTLGILCDPSHPVFRTFPTRFYSDWLWWELVHGASAIVLDGLPAGLKPLVQPIDTWHRSHKLGLLFEARVGRGRLVVTSMDLASDLDSRLVARQFRQSLLTYMLGTEFAPQVALSPEQIRSLWKKDGDTAARPLA